MASVAMILDPGQRIRAVPAGPSDVRRMVGNNYLSLSADGMDTALVCG